MVLHEELTKTSYSLWTSRVYIRVVVMVLPRLSDNKEGLRPEEQTVQELLTFQLQWFQNRCHKPEDVFRMGIHINHLLGIVPSILKLLCKVLQSVLRLSVGSL